MSLRFRRVAGADAGGGARVREAASRMRRFNNLRQMGLALHQYHDLYQQFPAGISYRNGNDPNLFMSWQARLLPFLEQQSLWQTTLQAYQQEKDFQVDPPHVGFASIQPSFICSSERGRRTWELLTASASPSLTIWVSKVSTCGVTMARFTEIRKRASRILRMAQVILLQSASVHPARMVGMVGGTRVGDKIKPGLSTQYWAWPRRITRIIHLCLSAPSVPTNSVPDATTISAIASISGAITPAGRTSCADGSAHFLHFSAAPLMRALATRSGGEPVALPD